MDVHISKNDCIKVKEMLNKQNIEYKITIEDLGKIIREQRKKQRNGNAYGWPWGGFDYEEFNRYKDIVEQLRSTSNSYSSSSKLTFLPHKTTRGLKVYGLRIHERLATKAKPTIILDGAMHGRDWITTSTLVYLTKILLDSSTEPALKTKITKVLKNYDIIIYPVVNPDGYEYTHYSDRFWRKTLSPQAHKCRGVDMNSNFGPSFGAFGMDKEDACSGVFPGKSAYSEKEVQNVALGINILQDTTKPGCIAYWNLHGFGQHIRYPYGYRKSPTWYDKELNRVASIFARGASKRYGKKYTAGRAADFDAPAGGQAIDWAYDKGGVTYAFAPHLRPGYGEDSGKSFVLPESEIKPTALEFADGFLDAMIAVIDG